VISGKGAVMPTTVVTERSSARHLPTVQAPGFVGRERELATLAHALSGPPAVMLVEGEAGIGKTRLLAK
jgi:hypothetical protein